MRLLSTDDPRVIGGIIAGYRKEARALIDQIHEICWYMRGGITREEAYNLSHEERKSIIKLIDANIKRVNETRLPIL
ncbi:hypothetical protein D3C87_628430 [compost metagenome]